MPLTDPDVILRVARKRWSCEGDGARRPARAEDCPGTIAPGDRYVEYLGEAAAYQSGSRHCRACAETFGLVPLDPAPPVPEA